MIKPLLSKGFTIVEMLIAIVVIGTIVGISTFGYRGWQEEIAKKQARSDLQMAASAMQNAKNFGSGYPNAIPSEYVANSGITLTYVGGNVNAYCLEARSSRFTSLLYSVDSALGAAPKTGACNSTYVLGAPQPSISAITSSSMTVTWAAVSGATSYIVKYGTSSPSTQAGCSASPCALTGLSSSTNYKVTVTANNQYTSKTSAVINANTAL